MKNSLLIIAVITVSFFTADAQNEHCGFDEHLDKMLAEDSLAMQTISDLQKKAAEMKSQRVNGEIERTGGPRIIPTVFHVIHQGGNENISQEQIEDQMRVLNEDFSRQNTDAANTRAEFLGVAANPNVEFRLAKLDPQGNCTDGIVRISSPKTFNASDDNGVKALSYWNSGKYFNVWVVATIDNDGQPGIILGYAQFPGFGGATTDGVVVRADYIGSIGTSANNQSNGRTLTHEVGHWLGLFHTFQGECNGFFDDQCDDTPPLAAATPSNCPLTANTCSNDNPDLPDQVENYMDYARGSCQNMYTLDQKDRIDGVLSGSRSQIFSTNNLNDTGVLLGETPCAPYADFSVSNRIVCAGDNIIFTDNSFNGSPSDYDWNLTGATPSTSASANPTVVYNTPGVYSVTLNVSNAQGNDSFTRTNYITVIPSTAVTTNWIGFEGFEETTEDYLILSDESGNTWEETTAASYTGSNAIVLNNHSGNPVDSEDEFQLPSVDLTQMNNPKIYFRLAYKERSGQSDRLRIYVSRNCGESWSLRYNKSGSSLATVSGTSNTSYTPAGADDWEQVDVNLATFASDDHVLIKFSGTSDAGNKIYLDDIQISGPLGVSDADRGFTFTVSPNPMIKEAQVSLEVAKTENYQITLMDVTGKQISVLQNRKLSAGKHTFTVDKERLTNSGIYLIQVDNGQGRQVQKLVVQ
jgi:PKD repeat protein